MNGNVARAPLTTRALARALVVAGVLFCSYAFFYQAGGWNQASRFDLVRAIVEHGTLRIDEYSANTGDAALVDGHLYSDKAPGLSLLSVPPVAAARPMLDAVGIDPASEGAITTLSYLATLVGAALPTALTGLGIYWLSLRLGASSAGAAFATVCFGVATPMWAFATLFWGHALAAALLFGGFVAAVSLREPRSESADVVVGGLAGVSVGWAVVSEFTAALPAVLIALLVVNHVWARDPGLRRRILVALVGGATLCGLVLLAYNLLAFGAPFDFGYSHVVNFPQQSEGVFGIGAPDPGVLAELAFGTRRGLLPLAPVLVAAPVGFYLLSKKRDARATTLVAGCIVLYYLVVTSGYFAWDGGATYAPRHLAPALPFLCFPLAAVWTRARWLPRTLLVVLALWGAAVSLVAVSTIPQAGEEFDRPVTELLWPAFRDGRLSLNTGAFFVKSTYVPPERVDDTSDREAWNAGELAGLAGHASLVPLYLLWAAGAGAWWWIGRAPGRRRSPPATRREPGRRATHRRGVPPATRAGAR